MRAERQRQVAVVREQILADRRCRQLHWVLIGVAAIRDLPQRRWRLDCLPRPNAPGYRCPETLASAPARARHPSSVADNSARAAPDRCCRERLALFDSQSRSFAKPLISRRPKREWRPDRGCRYRPREQFGLDFESMIPTAALHVHGARFDAVAQAHPGSVATVNRIPSADCSAVRSKTPPVHGVSAMPRRIRASAKLAA